MRGYWIDKEITVFDVFCVFVFFFFCYCHHYSSDVKRIMCLCLKWSKGRHIVSHHRSSIFAWGINVL